MCSFFFYLPRSVNLAITLISEVELLVLQSSKSLQNHNSAQSSVDSQSTSYEEKLLISQVPFLAGQSLKFLAILLLKLVLQILHFIRFENYGFILSFLLYTL